MKHQVARRNLALAAVLLLFTACRDEPTALGTYGQSGGVSHSVTAGSPQPGDHAIRMRTALRALSDGEARSQIEAGQNVVTIGFKTQGSPWGVDGRGVSLVSRSERDVRREFVEGLARRVIHRYEHIPAITVELPNADVALRLRRMPWVDYVAPATRLLTPDWTEVQCFNGPNGDPPPPGAAQPPQVIPWHVARVRADQAWALATGVSPYGYNLTVLDDGLEEAGTMQMGPELDWQNIYWFVPPVADGDGWHGTPVFGAAAARNNGVGIVGVAPGARANIVKIIDNRGGNTQWDYWAYVAFDWWASVSHVMTISYSTKNWTSPTAPPSFVPMYDAIKVAYYTYNVPITASTGNEGQPGWYAFPAAWPEVIGVGGSNADDHYVFHNYAPGNVDLAAPAVSILTVCKGGQIGFVSGTSFATPQVAGALMMLRERFPTEPPETLRERLIATAAPMGDPQKSGAGRMDVYAALTYTFPPPPPLMVSISGPDQVQPYAACLFAANPANGVEPYSYAWTADGIAVGSDSPFYRHPAGTNGFDLGITVTDGEGRVANNIFSISVSQSAPECLDQ